MHNSPPIPTPPQNLRFMETTEEKFISDGDTMLGWLRKHTSFHENSRILDIGSGYGRLAHALLRSGGFSGEYVGMDILPKHIAWCNENLGSLTQYPGTYKFHHLDIKNERYNPTGKLSVEDFQLDVQPCDVVVLTSVFTHMYIEDIRAYLVKIRNALNPAGEIFATTFMLNEAQAHYERLGRSRYPMTYKHTDHARYFNEESPLLAIGHEETFLKSAFLQSGLDIHKILYGGWCGRSGSEIFQDAIVAKRQNHA